MVIVRAGPYMCGEWEFGGLPSWLIQLHPTMQVCTKLNASHCSSKRNDEYYRTLTPGRIA